MEVTTALLYFCLAFAIYKILDFVYRLPSHINDLDSRYILITGCDSGFGNAAAKRLVAMGCHVVAGCVLQSYF